MAEQPNHYAALGLKPTATAAEIKRAYHRQAKAAHPDAGGNAETMAQVNEAYQILSDPVARHLYDQRSADAPETHQPHSGRPRRYIAEDPEAAHGREADRINRERTAWARHSAWELARLSAPITIAVIILTRFIITHAASSTTRLAAGFIAFIPVYALVLSLVFIMSPPLRLVFADLARRHPTTIHDHVSAFALILAFFPLAILWVLLFSR